MLDSISHVDHGAESHSPAIVLCHGFGADASDLAPLAQELALPFPARWFFPQAPYQFQMGWGEGRAWFPRDPSGVESFMAGHVLDSLGSIDPPALSKSSQELQDFLSASGCDPAATVVGGFSQGAMVAAAAVLDMTDVPAGLVLFSGSIVAQQRLAAMATARAQELSRLRVFQSHGRQDPVLPFANGRALEGIFAGAGAQTEFVEFDGGHGISPSALSAAREHIAHSLQPIVD